MSRNKPITLDTPVKKVPKDKQHTPHETPHVSSKEADSLEIPKYINGRLSFPAVYDKLLNDVQNERKLSKATCLTYDRVCKELLFPRFTDKPFDAYTHSDFNDCIQELYIRSSYGQLTPAKALIAIRMLRMIVKHAFEHGYTQVEVSKLMDEPDVTGPPVEDTAESVESTTNDAVLDEILSTDADAVEGSESPEEKEEGRELARKRINNSGSIPLNQELEVLLELLSQVPEDRTALGGLFMFALFNRTSEALGYFYKDHIEIPDAQYMLQYSVLEKDKRIISNGAKTTNGYRPIEMPRYLAAVLAQCMEELKDQHPDMDLDDLPVTSKGAIDCPAMQKELNDLMQEMYKRLGVSTENIELSASEMEDDKNADDANTSISAYLGRHQGVTNLVASGLPVHFIQMIVGHAIENSSVHREDQTNPDLIRELFKRINDLPANQLLNGVPEFIKFEPDSFPTRIDCDKFTVCLPPGEGEYDVEVYGLFPGDIPQIETKGLALISRNPLVPPNPERKFGMCTRTYLCPEKLRKLYAENGKADASIFGVNYVHGELPPDNILAGEAAMKMNTQERFAFLWQKPLPRYYAYACSSNNESPGSQLPTVEKKQIPLRYVEHNNLYLLALVMTDVKGKRKEALYPFPENCTEVLSLNKKGLQVAYNVTEVLRILRYDPAERTVLITPDGYLHSVCGREGDELFSQSELELLAGGAQLTPLTDDGILICMTAAGKIAPLFVSAIREDSERIVDVSQGDKIVSVCCLRADASLLLFSSKGKMLKIQYDQLYARKSLPTKPRAGISISQAEGVAVTCLSYQASDLIGVSTQGKLFKLSEARVSNQNSHGLNTAGNSVFRVGEGDVDRLKSVFCASEAVGILQSNNHILCIRSEFSKRENVPSGIQGTRNKVAVRDAIPVKLLPEEENVMEDPYEISDSSGDDSSAEFLNPAKEP